MKAISTIIAVVLILATIVLVYYFGGKPTPQPNPTSLIPRVEMTCDGQKCLK